MIDPYTPEPWEVFAIPSKEDYQPIAFCGCDDSVEYMVGQRKTRMHEGTALGDAKRIVACVNACAGMRDPLTEIKKMKERLSALDALGASIVKAVRQVDYIK